MAPDNDIDLEAADSSETADHTPPIVHTSLTDLRAAIKARFGHHMQDTDAPADIVDVYSDALADFIEEWFIKFAAGQREHGGDLRERDMRMDQRKELQDLLSYHLTDDVRPTSIRVRV
jgi:hypothetical protein